jgi:hypothetical protein
MGRFDCNRFILILSIILQLFITLLSSNSVKSKYCQDEVALAYISQKAIFPVAIESRKEIQEKMDTGL